MAALKPDYTRGFIVADPKFALSDRNLTDDLLATATQGDGIPGRAVSTGHSYMRLQTSGSVWTGETLTITDLKGGSAIPGASAGRFVWNGTSGGEGTTPRGWLPFNVASGYFPLVSAASRDGVVYSGVGVATKPYCIRLSTGDILFAAVNTILGDDHICTGKYSAGTGHYKPSYARYDAGLPGYVYDDRDAWSWTAEAVSNDDATDLSNPCLLELENRLLLFFTSLQVYKAGAQYYAVGCAYSDDGGSTWTVQTFDTGARIDSTNTPFQLQAVYSGGYVTLILVHDGGGSSSVMLHYYSADDGVTFNEIDESASVSVKWSPQIVACDDNTILLLFIKGGSGKLTIARQYGPATIFTDENEIIPSGASVNPFREFNDCMAVTMLEDRTIQAMVVTADDGTRGPTLRAVRLPQTVATGADEIVIPPPAETIEAEPIDYGAATASTQKIPSARSACMWGSSLLLVSDQNKASGIAICQLFGGYSSIDWNGPTFGMFPGPATDAVPYGIWWDAAYAPSTLPIWTTAGTGAEGTSVENLLSLDFSGGGANKYYTRSGTAGADVWLWMRVRQDSGGSLANNFSGCLLRSANGSFDYSVAVRLTTTGIRLVDVNAGSSTIDVDVTLSTASEMIDVLTSLTGTGRTVVWYKAATSQVWIRGPYGNATDKGAAWAATSLVSWGAITASTQKSTWAHVGSILDDWDQSLPVSVTEPAQPRYTFGREFSIFPLFVADGVRLSAASGPAFKGEAWTIAPSYTYPIANLDPIANPAPSLVWQSSSDAVEQIMGFDFGAEDGVDSALIGLYLQGANFLSLVFEQDDGAGGWTTVADVSTVAISGAFVRTGFQIKPATSETSGSLAVARDELVGTWVVLDDGGDLYYVKIANNSQGIWNGAKTAETGGINNYLPITLRLDATAAEVAALPTSGTISIIAPEVSVVARPAEDLRQQWRIRIPARSYVSAPEAYHQASVLLIGPYLPIGWEWGNAPTASMEPIQRTAETETGQRVTTQLSARPRRTREIVWTDVIPGADVLGAEAVPQAVAASSDLAPIAHQADPRQVEDLILRAKGAKYPVVFLPYVPQVIVSDTGGPQFIYGRDQQLYGTIVNGSTRTEPVSREGQLQLTTISACRIEEVKG